MYPRKTRKRERHEKDRGLNSTPYLLIPWLLFFNVFVFFVFFVVLAVTTFGSAASC